MAQTRIQVSDKELRVLIGILEPNITDTEDIRLLSKLKKAYVTVGGDMLGLGVQPVAKHANHSSSNEVERINKQLMNDEEISEADRAMYYQLTGIEL